MNYSGVCSQIKDGDLIAVRGVHNLLNLLTRFFTKSEYVHTGVAIWVDDILMMVELNSGKNHLIPLSQLDEEDFDVCDCPVPDNAAIRASIFSSLSHKIPYSFPALLVIGALDWFGIKMFLHARRMLVCSGFCVSIYEACGWPEHSRIISPAKLVESLTLKLQVRKA